MHFNMTRNIGVVSLLCLLCILALQPRGYAQGNAAPRNANSHNLIRPEYYAGLDFLGAGQTSQAAAAFETAFLKARAVNDQRGIDSVPAMVMLGECYLEQCDIGMALERYDGALQISLMGMRWLSLLKSPPNSIRSDSKRETLWAPDSRGAHMGTFTDAWPIVLGAPDTLLELPAGQGVVGKMLSIDALEILRCQALALRRRYQLLGPLAVHSPMTKPLLEAFRTDVSGQPDAIQCAVNICLAMAEIGNGERADAIRRLKQNLSLSNGTDHPLTAVALLALADLAIESDDMNGAEERSVEASLVSARANQMDHLYESVDYLSQCGLANGHDAAIANMLQAIIQWSGNKGRCITIQGQVAWARLLAIMGDSSGSKTHSVAATTMLLPTQIVLPRCEATLRYAKARTEFLDGKVSDGINTLYEGIAFLRGASNGIGVPSNFQLSMTLQLVQANQLKDDVAETILQKLLTTPSAGHWRSHPLEQIAWLTSDKSSAMAALLDIKLRTRTADEVVAAFDDAIRILYRQNGVLESRVMDLQQAFHGERQLLSELELQAFQNISKKIPLIATNASKISELLAPFQSNPKWDTRKWTEEETRRWETVQRLSTAQESLLWATAVSPLVIPEVFPPSHKQVTLEKSLQPSDATVYFYIHGNQLYGFIYQAGKWQMWNIGDVDKVRELSSKLNRELLMLSKRDGSATDLAKSWSPKQSVALRNAIFPKEIWSKLQESNRWVMVPTRFLWNVPFELFSLSDQSSALPCISAHRLCYAPTLGLVPRIAGASGEISKKHEIDVHVGDFFSRDPIRAKEIRDELANGRHFIADIAGKSNFFPSSKFFKIAASRLGAYVMTSRDQVVAVPTDRNGPPSSIQTWNRLPWGTPRSIILPGVTAPSSQENGDEWLRMMLPPIAQGTRQMLISRWVAGGESTANLMRNFADGQQDMPASEAWQRSVVNLWEEQFDQHAEPLFKDAPFAGTEHLIPGSHPLIWSGYVNVGE